MWFEDHTSAPTDGSARTGGRPSIRVVKGGSYDSSATGIAPAVRAAVTRAWKAPFIGFRVARSLP
jgi:formylglycine-generating enzyme required for sulfatase activity